MKNLRWILIGITAITLIGCNKNENDSNVVAQRFVHKYGFELSPNEWKERQEDGQIITQLDNGVTVTSSYVHGVLNGTTTYSYPNSTLIERLAEYDDGTLLKTVLYDMSGIPYREEVYEFDNKRVISTWDEKGIPQSIEEYHGNMLMKGDYFTSNNEQEAKVEEGAGTRIQRNRQGLLLSKDTIANGELVQRTSFHPNGQVHSTSSFKNYALHGKQVSFSPEGSILLEIDWNNGLIDGKEIHYLKGTKIQEVPYIMGKKQGMEMQYNPQGKILAQIQWDNDMRHGSSRFYDDEVTSIEWYYQDENVGFKKFQMMELRDKLMAELEKAPSSPRIHQ